MKKIIFMYPAFVFQLYIVASHSCAFGSLLRRVRPLADRTLVLLVQYSAIGIVLAVCCVLSCNSSNQKILPAYNADTTKLSAVNGVYYYNNAPFTGKYFALYKNGDTVFSNEYSNGKENGWCRKWYVNHQLGEARFFINGKKEGNHVAYWSNANKKFDYHLHDDKFEGMQQEWFADGNLYGRKNYLDGHEHGLQQMWDSTGKLVINYESVNGRNYGNIGTKNCRSLWKSDSFAMVH